MERRLSPLALAIEKSLFVNAGSGLEECRVANHKRCASIDNQRANLEIRFWPGEGEEPLRSPNSHPSGGCRWKCQLGAGLVAALLSIAFC